MVNQRQVVRAILCGLLLSLFSLASASAAYGQDFTLSSPLGLSPAAVDRGVSATATLSVQPVNAMSAPTVNLTCSVSPVETDGPVCPNPGSVVAPARPGLTVNTFGDTPQISYIITVTGTDASGTQVITLPLTVLAVTGDYTITVTTPLNPSNLHAGSGTSGVVTLTPNNGYTGDVTLACSSVTPAVIPAPQCSFNPVPVKITTSSGAPTAIITIITAGPTTALRSPRIFYALWLLVPGLALAGVGSAAGRNRKVLGGMSLLTLVAGILLIPACGGSPTNSTTIPGTTGVTPKNTYTFTLTGVDQNGLAPSNTSPTVNLTVD